MRRPFVFQSEELFPAEPKPLGSYFAVSCPGDEYHRRVDMWASQRRACAVPLLHRRQAHGTLYICADTQANRQKHTPANKVQSKLRETKIRRKKYGKFGFLRTIMGKSNFQGKWW